MAAINGSSEVTYTFATKDRIFLGKQGYLAKGTILINSASGTYASGGIAVVKKSMGLPHSVYSMNIIETDAAAYDFEYDVSAEKLRVLVPSFTTGNAVGTLATNGASFTTASNTRTEGGLEVGNAAANTAYQLIKYAELAAGATLPAITLVVEAKGW